MSLNSWTFTHLGKVRGYNTSVGYFQQVLRESYKSFCCFVLINETNAPTERDSKSHIRGPCQYRQVRYYCLASQTHVKGYVDTPLKQTYDMEHTSV